MKAIKNHTIGYALLKALFQLLPFLIMLYSVYPHLAWCKDVDNILLPNGKTPKLKNYTISNLKYISLSEIESEFLKGYKKTMPQRLEYGENSVTLLNGSFFIVSEVKGAKFVAQLSRPVADINGESAILYADFISILPELKLMDTLHIDGNLCLKEYHDAPLNNGIALPDSFDFSDNPEITDVASEETIPQVAKTESDALASDEKEAEESVSKKDTKISAEISAASEPIIAKVKINPVKPEFQNSQAEVPTENIAMLASATTNAMKANSEAFKALRPTIKKVVYLPTNINQGKPVAKSEMKEEIVKDKSEESATEMPPNVYTVPKGLFRRGIDKKN
jgi:hypothetical protein